MKYSIMFLVLIVTLSSCKKDKVNTTVGSIIGGGIVFNIWQDASGVEHGLIASLDDLSPSQWSNATELIGSTAQDPIDGQANTAAIVNQVSHISSAALACDNYSNEGYNDWYLPATWELKLIYDNAYTLNIVLRDDGNPATNSFGYVAYYWSSNEWGATDSWALNCFNNTWEYRVKTSTARVRAIRRF